MDLCGYCGVLGFIDGRGDQDARPWFASVLYKSLARGMAATCSSASERRDPLRRADKNDEVPWLVDRPYLNTQQLSKKGYLCFQSQELQGR